MGIISTLKKLVTPKSKVDSNIQKAQSILSSAPKAPSTPAFQTPTKESTAKNMASLANQNKSISTPSNATLNTRISTANQTLGLAPKAPSTPRSSGGSNTAGVGGAFTAIKSILGGGNESTYGGSETQTPINKTSTSYKGTPGTETVTSAGNYRTPLSNEAQAQQRATAAQGQNAASDRANQSNIISQAQGNREAQLAALKSQESQTQAAYDAAATAEATQPQQESDPILASFDQEEKESQKLERQLRAIQSEIERAQQLTPEEQEAQKRLDEYDAQEANINASTRAGITNIQGQPIPQGFLTGQASALEKMANNRLESIAAAKIPLTQQIAQAQSRRKAAEAAARGQAGYIESAYSRASGRNKSRRDYQIDTRKEEKDAKAKEAERQANAEKERYQVIGDGSLLYDKVTGKVVANNPKNFAPKETNNDLPDWLK